MNAIVLLFLAGIVLLVFEVITPGAVLGVLGGLAMLAGCAVAFYRYGAGGGGIATAAGLGILGVALYVEFVLLPKTRVGRKMFLERSVDATSQPPLAAAESVIGKTCEALTTLAPSGYVLVEGKRYEAFSQSGLIGKGALLQVVGVDNFRLIVNKTSP
jgi:membrane-bound serine protease (ClpP class)